MMEISYECVECGVFTSEKSGEEGRNKYCQAKLCRRCFHLLAEAKVTLGTLGYAIEALMGVVMKYGNKGSPLRNAVEQDLRERRLHEDELLVCDHAGMPERILNVPLMPSWAIDAGRD